MATIPSSATISHELNTRSEPPVQTEVASAQFGTIPRIPMVTGATATVPNRLPGLSIQPQKAEPTLVAQPSGARSIAAVVLDVSDVSVAIACYAGGPSGTRVRISLPKELVPEELAKYGTPVTLSLETSGRIRYPTVSRRMYVRSDAKTAEELEIDSWIDSL